MDGISDSIKKKPSAIGFVRSQRRRGSPGGCCKCQTSNTLQSPSTKKPTNQRRGRPAVGSLSDVLEARCRSGDQWFGSAGVRGMTGPLAAGGPGALPDPADITGAELNW